MSDVSDIAMPLIAKLGQCLGLETIDEESAHLYTDKFAMRTFCQEHDMDFPEFCLCRTVEEAKSFFERVHSDIVIKPLDCYGSRGVYRIKRNEDLDVHFDEALELSNIQKAILAERYIDGPEFTIDGIKTPEKHFTLAISEKNHFDHNSSIARELYFTSHNNLYDYEKLAEQNNHFIECTHLNFGLTHAEYKYENGRFYLLDIAARGGGSLISSHIVPYLSGVDNYRYLLECSLGKITSPDFTVSEQYRERCAVLHFFETPKGGGIVREVSGADFLSQHPQVIAYQFNFKIGDIIADATSDADRAGFYIACCENRAELDKLVLEIQKKVNIICSEV